MKKIPLQTKKRAEVTVPGSKSLTHRVVIAAALSDGPCRIANALDSEDTRCTRNALRCMGIEIRDSGTQVVVHGRSGRLMPCSGPIDLGNSGTSMRLLTGVAALGRGTHRLTGTRRMAERPIQDLLDALNRLGVPARSIDGSGCPPVEIRGGGFEGGETAVSCRISSQFLSALLLPAPYTRRGVDIEVVDGPVSKPYVDLTVDVMEMFGVSVKRDGYRRFQVKGGRRYRSGEFTVEPDASQAGYFWAAAAITGTRIRVNGTTAASRQGDVGFTGVLASMGCRVAFDEEGIAVEGARLNGVTVDMADMPDLVPTLAVVAAFARGETVIRNVGHLRDKESDRLAAVVNELAAMGIDARQSGDDLLVSGGNPTGAVIRTYNDHRIAMSFALAGLRVPGVRILDEACVEKSFPNFWEVLGTLQH